MANPLNLKPGSVLKDNDVRSPDRQVTVKAIQQRGSQYFVLYQGAHRRSRISFDRINEDDGRPHSQGYTIVSR